ncbi:DsbC family protein [Moraxella nasicaprae]|uniref:Thiol:disulfide interchange protein n=1 Tax=Moraxella nasicaprae TaxID=2904122 RepID=A0ABY6F2S9_9GAMM|nr:DsbC family protein [Moraxella nasicaprae]UXZ04377.1 DsbC family protein [Moraxella nasicaprae]
MKTSFKFCAAMLLSAFALTACNKQTTQAGSSDKQAQTTAQPAENNQAVVDALQASLKASNINDLTVKTALPTAMPEVYWVSFDNAPAMFTDKTGSYLIQGQIIKIGDEKPADITADIIPTIAKSTLSQIPTDEMIISPAKGETKAAIYVFTDPTCHYCQKLHGELEQINAGGVEVRYLAWPRNEATVPMTQHIWCAADRLTTLGEAKHGKTPPPASCDNPVRKHMSIGLQLGVSGTPAVFTESGQQIGGYIPADELIQLAIQNR